ncbi:MAG: hypothetical protein LBH47_00535 [Christensenellaceae bacterium]|jgi:vacuolar-type H+-ATPase subunit E/Vma4|nr:hypothetical protein [Christensenellaceae bacterium]
MTKGNEQNERNGARSPLAKKIISDAQKEVRRLIMSAGKNAEEKIQIAREENEKRKRESFEDIRRQVKVLREQRKLAGQVENIRNNINAKQQVLTEVYLEVQNSNQVKEIVKKLQDKYKPARDYDYDISMRTLIADLREEIDREVAQILYE